MKRKGSALIYVLILMIPVMFISISLLEISNINFKISTNAVYSRQALYNAEAGLAYGIKKLELNNYDKSYSGYNNERYVLFDGKSSAAYSKNYSETNISCFNNTFTITSRGYYKGFNKTKNLIITRKP